MIYFWWSAVFKQPEILELEYFCRIDTDSVFNAQIPNDIFQVMRERSYIYGYRVQDFDNVAVTDGMWEFVSTYLQNHPRAARQAIANGWRVPPRPDWETSPMDVYYNNFEVMDNLF